MALKPDWNLLELDRRQLCEFASELCGKVDALAGKSGFKGGIYYGNVSISDAGDIVLGDAGDESPEGAEMLYAAPELYWHGKRTPACDVYSIGLLLYYLSEKRLPFESSECGEKKARQLRMQGSAFNPPENAGKRLGDIIMKALSFEASDRYRNPGEMKIMLDNCIKNLFLREEPYAQAVFNKEDDSLSDIERMMVSIMETHNDLEENAEAGTVDETAQMVEPLFEEAGEVQGAEAADAADAAEEEVAEEAGDAAETAEGEDVDDGAESADIPEFYYEEPDTSEPETDVRGVPMGSTEETISEPEELQPEDIFTYEKPDIPEETVPVREPEQPKEPVTAPDLQPIKVKKKKTRVDDFPDIIVTNTGETVSRSKKEIQAAIRKRRARPVIFIIVLSILLIISAIVFNKLTSEEEPGPELVLPEETAPVVMVTAEPEKTEPEPVETEPVEMVSEYIFYQENVSWETARERCEAAGGHLVVINDAAELQKVIDLAENYNVSVVWIGLHRQNGMLVWETDDVLETFFYNWDENEPSEYDGDTPENYVFLWNWTGRGWVYNDCINDPAGDYPESYWNQIGYVCEIEKPVTEVDTQDTLPEDANE